MQRSLVPLVLVAFVGCAARDGVRPEPFPLPSGPPETVSSGEASSWEAVTTTALNLTGTPYRAGGDTPQGFDCSGFTRYVFGRHGISLPRLAQEQFLVGHVVELADLRPGDLVFFTTVEPGASHVGVALDGDTFIHAPSERGQVRVERLSTRYWSERFLGARRIVE